MPFPCRSPAATLPRLCHYPAILLQRRTRAGRPHSVSGRPMLIHTYHAVPLPRTCRGRERSLSVRHSRGMAGERHGMCESAFSRKMMGVTDPSGRSLVGIAGSNPAGNMVVCVLWMLCDSHVSATGRISRGVLPSVRVSLSVIRCNNNHLQLQ
jgi:hypothetical protein